jgi:DNA repair protein RecN (Recombination protein N)
VSKVGGATAIRALSEDERPQELARMLSGEVTEVSLAHARDLIQTGRPA